MSDHEETGDGIPETQFSQLLSAIKESHARFDAKLTDFREEMRQFQEEAATKALKRARHEKPYQFKRKGNEEQATFNAQVDEALAEAQLELPGPSTSPALERAHKAIERGRRLLAERQKLIRIADRSELGWSVVSEYTADELADNSDDEKRLEKAERSAERKLAKRKKKRAEPAQVKQNARFLPAQAATPAGTTPFQFPPRRPPATVSQPFRVPGPCFACGEMGHIRSRCPKTASGVTLEPRKWYPFRDDKDEQFLFEPVEGTCAEREQVDVGKTMLDKQVLCDTVKGMCTEREEAGAKGSMLESAADVELCEWQREPEDVCIWELGMEDVCTPAEVKGRLKRSVSFWREELKASEFILNTIEHGYVLPLKSEPSPFVGKNQVSTIANKAFVEKSIKELLVAQCVRQVASIPHICSPLSVVESKSGKKRLVVNLRHLNMFLWKQTFKYEDLRIAMLLLEKGDYLFSFDLKSGYHHVEIAEVHHKYLGFAWDDKFYVFTVLPFGLASACYIFTKLLRPLVAYWRSKGLKSVVYLDDGLCAAMDYAAAVKASLLVRETLDCAGFVVHPTKCIWDPTQRLVWLGFVIDVALGRIEVPQEKIVSLQGLLRQVRLVRYVQARKLASIIGQIISMGLAIGPISRFMTRRLYALLESRQAWCEQLLLSSEARDEIVFWEECLSEYKSQPIWHAPSAVRVVYSDASETGYGGYVVEHGPCVAYGQWTTEEAKQSSTWRELTAVLCVLEAMAKKLANARVRWFSDNQNVARILLVGSRKPHLQSIALKIFSLSVRSHIKIEPEWIPRQLNVKADLLSRIVDFDDWRLNPEVFIHLDKAWGPHTVDRFASFQNCQLPRFNSRCWNPGSEAVDAFTVHWGGEVNWWCPPIPLVPRVIRHAQVCAAKGTLIVPCWPSAPFWPLICRANGQFASFVTMVEELPLSESLFLPGMSGSVLFNGKIPNTKVFALRCNFSIQPVETG